MAKGDLEPDPAAWPSANKRAMARTSQTLHSRDAAPTLANQGPAHNSGQAWNQGCNPVDKSDKPGLDHLNVAALAMGSRQRPGTWETDAGDRSSVARVEPQPNRGAPAEEPLSPSVLPWAGNQGKKILTWPAW